VCKKKNRSVSTRDKENKRWAGRDEYWRDLITRQYKSEVSVADFCAQEGVFPTSFYSWRKKLGLVTKSKVERTTGKLSGHQPIEETSGVDSFIKMEVGTGSGSAGVMVELVEGTRIVLSKNFDQEVLKQALQIILRSGI